MDVSELSAIFDADRERIINEWKHLLRFKTVSNIPGYQDELARCSDWLRTHLSDIGLQSELVPTPTQPFVYGERIVSPDLPTVLYYGHFDVQPPEPLDAWETPPFEPDIRFGRIFARGARDNKGQHFLFLKSLEELIRRDKLLCNIKIVLDPEEESGSDGLLQVVSRMRDRFKADYLLAYELPGMNNGDPALTVGLRGAAFITIQLKTAARDLHSGHHGGRVLNPATEISKLISTLHDSDGRVAVKGFYDDVEEISPIEKEFLSSVTFDEEHYLSSLGLKKIVGERGYSPVELIGCRPTLEVNGISAGFAGVGTKTIVPAESHVNLSTRLVPDQDPERVLSVIKEHFQLHLPDGIEMNILEEGVCAPALRCRPDAPVITRAREVIQEITGSCAELVWSGASIPMIYHIAECSGAVPVLVGFGTDEDNEHAPNESFSIEQFKKGFVFTGRFLTALPETS